MIMLFKMNKSLKKLWKMQYVLRQELNIVQVGAILKKKKTSKLLKTKSDNFQEELVLEQAKLLLDEEERLKMANRALHIQM